MLKLLIINLITHALAQKRRKSSCLQAFADIIPAIGAAAATSADEKWRPVSLHVFLLFM